MDVVEVGTSKFPSKFPDLIIVQTRLDSCPLFHTHPRYNKVFSMVY
jgi:hypothetical protein